MFAAKFKYILVFLFCFCFMVSVSAKIKRIGVPFIQNFAKSQYLAGNQNWSVTRDENGIMYFGNADGLLSFDGRYWQLYHMPHRLIVRCVTADQKGKIYTGAFGEFGFWETNSKGIFTYRSLVSLVPKKFVPNEEIWKIYVDGDRVLFQSFGSIYIYAHGRITVVKAHNPYLFLYKIGNRFFVEQVHAGLSELKNTQLVPIPGSNILSDSGVLSILPFGDGKYLIGTAKAGLFIYDGQTITPWANQANDYLKTYQLNNGAIITGGYFAFGTILNGIVILDSSGNIVQLINKLSGLQNNTVLSLYTDAEQNLWAGLDNGIDRIEVNSPIYFYFDKTGKFGTVYSSIVFNGKIYLGTNQGLFYSDWIADVNSKFLQTFDFKLIPGSQGQVWDLSLQDGHLLCGHNDGTFEVKGNAINKMSTVNGGWTIRKLSNNLLIQGTYTGLVVYRKDAAGRWIFDHKIQGFVQPARFVEQDADGQIWVSHAYKGVYKLKLSPDLTKVVSQRYYDSRSGLPDTYNVSIFNLNNRILFSSESGFCIYDNISDRFYAYHQLNSTLGSFASSNKIIPAADKKYWFINHGHVGLADFEVAGKISIDSNSFNMITGQMVKQYENINRINDAMYLISVDDGFVILNSDEIVPTKLQIPRVLIRKIENTTDRVTLIADNSTTANNIEIPYSQNNLRISYALPYFRHAKVRYRYFLEGYSRGWSEWTAQSQKEFTNLNHGDYQFKVQAQINDENLSAVTIFLFTVDAPWYATTIAWVIYVLFIGVAIYYSRKYYHLKLQRHQHFIHEKMQREKEEFLRQEALANEQHIVQIKNEQLQADLASKSRELANSAMNIVYKNELLQKISVEMEHLKDSNGKPLSPSQLHRIQKVIDEGMNDQRDWNIFETSFNEAHENFFKKLKSDHPDLVPNDLKLCAYLRMNMSSKEMASLLNISLRGVEIRRYRLRKKLNLEHDKNLVEFLMEL